MILRKNFKAYPLWMFWFLGKKYKDFPCELFFRKNVQGLPLVILRKNFNAYPLWMFWKEFRISHVNLFWNKTIRFTPCDFEKNYLRFTPCDFEKKLMLTPCECFEKIGFTMWFFGKKTHKVYPLWFWEKTLMLTPCECFEKKFRISHVNLFCK